MILEHVGITVSDLEKSIGFYTKVFGFSLLKKNTISILGKTTTNAYLYLDNELLELMQSEAPTGAERPQTPEAWIEYMKGAAALKHIGFRVDNLDETIEKIKNLGGELIVPLTKAEPETEYVAELAEDKFRRAAKPITKPYWRIAMFRDPDGVILEILER